MELVEEVVPLLPTSGLDLTVATLTGETLPVCEAAAARTGTGWPVLSRFPVQGREGSNSCNVLGSGMYEPWLFDDCGLIALAGALTSSDMAPTGSTCP